MLPIMRSKVNLEEKIIKTFKGINVRDDYASGEICEELNMSSDMYPALCTRKSRPSAAGPGRMINGIGNCEGIIYTYSSADGRKHLNFGGKDYDFSNFSNVAANSKRRFAALSDSVMIIPDNVIFTPSSGKFSKICVNQSGNGQSAKSKFNTESKGSTLLDNATSWHLGYVAHNSLRCRTASYTKSGTKCDFYYFAFDSVLKSGDVVTIKMSVKSDEANDQSSYSAYRKKMEKGITVKIKDVVSSTHNTANGSITESVELIFDSNVIDTNGYDDLVFDTITIEKTMPELKMICSFNNRIWGITDKELCCSKLGDASEWNDFTVDSYGTLPYACFSTAAPTEGDFTAVMSFGNYIYAFKENVVHKLYGDNPDEFVLKTLELRGVSKGKEATLAKSDSAVFYCNDNEIFAFTDTATQKISYPLGDSISCIAGASDGEKYYVLTESDGRNLIYVYDIRLKLWHCEDADNEIRYLCCSGNDVIAASESKITYLNSKEGQSSGFEPDWSFRIRFDEKLFEKKGFGKISVRYSLGDNAFFTVRATYDDGYEGALCGAKHDEIQNGGGYVHIPVRRSLGFALRFKGKGSFCLKSLKIQFYRGSDI